METLQKYVPRMKEVISVPIPSTYESEEVEKYNFHQILFGGDQLTAVCARAAQQIRANSEIEVGRLEGLVPTAEDWHANICFWRYVKVCKLIIKVKTNKLNIFMFYTYSIFCTYIYIYIYTYIHAYTYTYTYIYTYIHIIHIRLYILEDLTM